MGQGIKGKTKVALGVISIVSNQNSWLRVCGTNSVCLLHIFQKGYPETSNMTLIYIIHIYKNIAILH